MTTIFTQASSLIDFQNAVWDLLTNCGMDTIAYLPDPESSSMVTNVVKSHSHYTVATAKTPSSQLLLHYNKYHKSKNLAATKFLITSLNPALMSKVKRKPRIMTRFMSSGSTSSKQSSRPKLSASKISKPQFRLVTHLSHYLKTAI
ncbi:hypothetical protein MHU86_3613 [Fragilaria crotonensis]|nr:hypothetical protein MHU86_3613 [Fragilaria crotonensis]